MQANRFPPQLPGEASMNHGIKLFVHHVSDVGAAKALYTKLLGVEPYVSQPYYVGFRLGEQEFGLVPSANGGEVAAPIAYWTVDDIEKTLASLIEAGAQLHQAVKSVGGGKLIAAAKDTDGNLIWLAQA